MVAGGSTCCHWPSESKSNCAWQPSQTCTSCERSVCSAHPTQVSTWPSSSGLRPERLSVTEPSCSSNCALHVAQVNRKSLLSSLGRRRLNKPLSHCGQTTSG